MIVTSSERSIKLTIRVAADSIVPIHRSVWPHGIIPQLLISLQTQRRVIPTPQRRPAPVAVGRFQNSSCSVRACSPPRMRQDGPNRGLVMASSGVVESLTTSVRAPSRSTTSGCAQG